VGFEFDVIFDPEGARQVLATDAASYDKDVPIFDEFRRVIGNGLITSGGDRWRRDRRIVAPVMTRRTIQSHLPTIAAAAERLVASWTATAEAKGTVELHRSSMHYALDVLGATVFGEDVEVLAPVFEATIPLLSEYATQRALSPVRLPASWPLPANRRAERARRQLWDLVDDLIARRRAAIAARDNGATTDDPPSGGTGGEAPAAAEGPAPTGGANPGGRGPKAGRDLLDLLLEARDPETGEALDDVSVRDQALTFLAAGHETTASTLSLGLHLLGRDQQQQQRVRDEANEAGTGDPEHLPVATDVVNETLRLYPAGHTVVRRASQDTTIAGYPVPKGRILAVSIWGIHRNPKVWEDPLRFKPERFRDLDQSGEGGRYTHLPFGGGPRGCIGQHLATVELVVAVAAIVRAYRLESLVETPRLFAGASVRPRDPLPCRISPAAG
jgi:cytochrome P450